MTKELIISVVALIIAISAVLVGRGGDSTLGGTTQSGWTIGTGLTSTSTLNVENAGTRGGCIALKQADGSGYAYVFATPTGSLGTTTSCS